MSTKKTLELCEGQPFGELLEKFKDQPRLDQIEFVDAFTADEFRNRILPEHYPVVFRSATQLPSQSEILNLISEDSRQIQVRIGDYAKAGATLGTRKHLLMTVEEYIDKHLFESRDGPPPYAGRIEFSKGFLSPYADTPSFYPAGEFEAPFVWLGSKGCTTQLHKDGSKNFAIHLFGLKRWTLFPPRDAKNLYLERVLEDSDFATSSVDMSNLDLDSFPLFNNAQSVTVDLKAGEVLYLPEGWAHHVENLKPTLMVNYWHRQARRI